MSKAREFYKQEIPTKDLKVHKKYITKASRLLQQKREKTKKQCPPQYEPNQSTKSITDRGPKAKTKLDQAQRLQRKECFSP